MVIVGILLVVALWWNPYLSSSIKGRDEANLGVRVVYLARRRRRRRRRRGFVAFCVVVGHLEVVCVEVVLSSEGGPPACCRSLKGDLVYTFTGRPRLHGVFVHGAPTSVAATDADLSRRGRNLRIFMDAVYVHVLP